MTNSLVTFFFELANFIALLAALAWLFFKPVREALERQRAKLHEHREAAANALEEAKRVRGESDQRRSTLQAELDALREEARENAEQEARRIVDTALVEIERKREAIKREAIEMERAQLEHLRRQVAELVSDVLTRFLRRIDGPELERSLLVSACRELSPHAGDGLVPVTIESAAPLSPECEQLIEASLGVTDNGIQYRVVPELLGGTRIATARGVVDATIAGLAAFAEETVKAELVTRPPEEAMRD